MSTQDSFRCEIENSGVDQEGNKVTTVKCDGRLVSDTVGEFKEAVKALIPQGGRIVLDLTNVKLVDSSALASSRGLLSREYNQQANERVAWGCIEILRRPFGPPQDDDFFQ